MATLMDFSTVAVMEQHSEITDLVSKRIGLLMKDKGLYQKDLAAIVGVSQPQVAERLRGKVAWRIDELERLAEHFDFPITAFFEVVDLGFGTSAWFMRHELVGQ